MSLADRLTNTVRNSVRDWSTHLGLKPPIPTTDDYRSARLLRILQRNSAYSQTDGLGVHLVGWLLGFKACGEQDFDVEALRKQANETADSVIKRAAQKIEMTVEFANKERDSVYRDELQKLLLPFQEGAEKARFVIPILDYLRGLKYETDLIDFDVDISDQARSRPRMLCHCRRANCKFSPTISDEAPDLFFLGCCSVWLTPFGKEYLASVKKGGFWKEIDGCKEWISFDGE